MDVHSYTGSQSENNSKEVKLRGYYCATVPYLRNENIRLSNPTF